MSIFKILAEIPRRLRSKLIEIVPILVGALLLLLVISLVMYILSPWLPESLQRFVEQIQQANWAAGRDSVARFFDDYGSGKPYAFLAAQVLQVVAAPIPGQFVGLLGGYLFGFWQGLFLSMIGLAIGSFIAIGLGRLLGKQVVRKLVPRSVMDKFDYLLSDGALWNFFILFVLPALPDDALCFIAGLTRLRMAPLLLVCLLGRLPGMAVLTFLGSSVGTTTVLANIILAVALIIALALWLFSEEVEAYFYRLAKRN